MSSRQQLARYLATLRRGSCSSPPFVRLSEGSLGVRRADRATEENASQWAARCWSPSLPGASGCPGASAESLLPEPLRPVREAIPFSSTHKGLSRGFVPPSTNSHPAHRQRRSRSHGCPSRPAPTTTVFPVVVARLNLLAAGSALRIMHGGSGIARDSTQIEITSADPLVGVPAGAHSRLLGGSPLSAPGQGCFRRTALFGWFRDGKLLSLDQRNRTGRRHGNSAAGRREEWRLRRAA